MERNKELPKVHPKRKSVPICCEERERGIFRKTTGPSKDLELSAEERLIERDHEEFECKFPDFLRSSFLMVFSADRKLIASTHGNRNVYVNDLTTGKHIKTLTGHPRTPWCIAFHPSTNQILASGCLGGQVRVWDLHGGSEIWSAKGETVIASLAFHPTDHVLVIATYNEIHFWDWSKDKPFAKCSTSDDREKVRYVSFDRYGHKLITGIGNVLRLPSQWDQQVGDRDGIYFNVSYQHMLEQYERLVERYARLIPNRTSSSSVPRRSSQQPRQTMDRGTDPMELNDYPRPGPTRCSVCSRDTASSSSGTSVSSIGSWTTSTTTTQTSPTSFNSIGVTASMASSTCTLSRPSSSSNNAAISTAPLIPSSPPSSPSTTSTSSISSPSSSSSSSSSNASDPPPLFSSSRTSPFRSASTEERRRHSAGTDEISASHSSSRFLSPPNMRSTSLSNLLRSLSEYQRTNEDRTAESGPWTTLNQTLALRRQESRRIMEQLSSELLSSRNRDPSLPEDQNPIDLPSEPETSNRWPNLPPDPLNFNENRPSAFRPASSAPQSPQNDEFANVQEGMDLVNQHIQNMERLDIDETQLNRIRRLWDLLQRNIRTLQREVRETNTERGDNNNNSNPEPGPSRQNEAQNTSEEQRDSGDTRARNRRDQSSGETRARSPDDDNLSDVSHVAVCGCNVCSLPSLRSRSIQFLRNLVDDTGQSSPSSRVIRVRISPVAPGRSSLSPNEPSTSSSSGRNGFPRRRLCPFSRSSGPLPKRPRVDSSNSQSRNGIPPLCNCCQKPVPPRPGRKTDHRQNAQNDSNRPGPSTSQPRSPRSRNYSPLIFFKPNRNGSSSGRNGGPNGSSRFGNPGPSSSGRHNPGPSSSRSNSGLGLSSGRPSGIIDRQWQLIRESRRNSGDSSRSSSSSSGISVSSADTPTSDNGPSNERPNRESTPRTEVVASFTTSLNSLRNLRSIFENVNHNLLGSGSFQRSSYNARNNFSSWYHDAVRRRARHVIPLMVEGLTQFFEYDTSAAQADASSETFTQRIGSVINLLGLALNLCNTLLTQLLDTSRVDNQSRSFQELRWAGLAEFQSVRRNPQSSFAPPHRIQAWDFTKFSLPDISNAEKNLVVSECKIHNDASVDVSRDGELLVTLMSTTRFNVTTMLGIYSLNWDTLGQCLYTTVFDQSAVSVSLSPTSKHLIVGFASRRTISFFQSEKQKIAKIYKLETSDNPNRLKQTYAAGDPRSSSKGNLSLVKELKMSREPSDLVSLNCIRWAPTAGEGFVYATNVGKLKIAFYF